MLNIELSDSQIYITEELNPTLGNINGDFLVRFWGVRGLIPTPSSSTTRYGGNTACVEMYVAGQRLIFDGGTGLRVLGKTYQQQQPLTANLFFTNSQSNRIQGFPFFAPAFSPENSFYIYGISASNGASIKQYLCDQMLQPYFPYPLQRMKSQMEFCNLTPGKIVELNDIKITTALINKNQRSVGYRIDWQEYSVAYTTDLHDNLDLDEERETLKLIQDVDLLIANATYNPPTSYNHESAELLWKIAVDLAHRGSVKKLVITHHHPDDHDDFLDKIQDEVNTAFPDALVAREGMVFYLNS
ncbi:MBL fold metallo-hydrolase [Cronbergia sp. UHCC 0137]|uniref:MBL fold metallo-hydrolase n=1 Tax=Cronbergia sp. UHCC 0137 TaxID=3110239 RepID=UPI002B20973A|nr:MBL fold metallo-hydrolase [Cronbergia sp. UHCC 0137]MEA5620261.1 MBL fold metallo-hydrolase [Cronbergia sp. UHCC 0137]